MMKAISTVGSSMAVDLAPVYRWTLRDAPALRRSSLG